MNSTPIHLLAAAAILAAASLPAQDADHHDAWFADYDKALAHAKAEDMDLLVDFTGSDWCGWCIRLHEEVFSKPEFMDYAKDNFVLVALDYPRSEEAKAKVPNPERNQELVEKYGIRGYPTILLMNEDEVVLGRTGYQPGGAEAYVEHLGELKTKGLKAIEDVKAIEEAYAKADDKVPVIQQAAGILAGMTAESPGVDKVAAIVIEAHDQGGDEHLALRRDAILALLKSGQGDREVRMHAKELDPKNEHGMLEQVVQAELMEVEDDESARAALTSVEALLDVEIKDAEVGAQIFSFAARFCAHPRGLGDAERAKPFAKKALALGIENPRLKEELERIAGTGGEQK